MPGFVTELWEDMRQNDRVAKAFEAALREVETGSCTYYSMPTQRTTFATGGDGVIDAVCLAYEKSQGAKAWLKKSCAMTTRKLEKKKDARVNRRQKAPQDPNGSHRQPGHSTPDTRAKRLASFDFQLAAPLPDSQAEQASFNFHQRSSSVVERRRWRAFHILGAPVVVS